MLVKTSDGTHSGSQVLVALTLRPSCPCLAPSTDRELGEPPWEHTREKRLPSKPDDLRSCYKLMGKGVEEERLGELPKQARNSSSAPLLHNLAGNGGAACNPSTRE